MFRKLKYSLVLLLASLTLLLPAQEWLVPEDQAALTNPLEYNEANALKGKELYLIHCKSCHGDPGKNNFLPLDPPPPDLTSALMQSNSEGSLYYKINEGRGGMPQFRTVLSDNERWNLVNFIMNYNPDRTPVIIEKAAVLAVLAAEINKDSSWLEVHAKYQAGDGSMRSLAGTAILVSARRTFGSLPLTRLMTDEDGNAIYELPEDVIGDEQGYVDVLFSLGDEYDAESLLVENAGLGVPKGNETHIRQGVLWSTNDNMPYWLRFSFFLALLGAWATIGYVVLQVVKIARHKEED